MHKSFMGYKSNISKFWKAIWTLKSKWKSKCGWTDIDWKIIEKPLSYYKPIWFTAYKSPNKNEDIYLKISWSGIIFELGTCNKLEKSVLQPIQDDIDYNNILTIDNQFISGTFQKEHKEFKINSVDIGCEDIILDFPYNYWKVGYYLSWDYIKLNFSPSISDFKWNKAINKYELLINNLHPLKSKLTILEDFIKNQQLNSKIIELYTPVIEDYLKNLLLMKWIQSNINNLFLYAKYLNLKKDELLPILIIEVKKDILIIKNLITNAIDFIKYDKLKFETAILQTARDMWNFFALKIRNDWWSIDKKDIENNYFSNLITNLKWSS